MNGYLVAVNFASLNGLEINVETQDYTTEGTHDMIIKVLLPEYNISLEIPFKLTIEACVVTDIHVTHPIDLILTYYLGDPALEEPIPETFLTPSDCGQFPTYTLYD